ncbi:MAG: hypothetical protein JW840_06400 [Candidatus Thermoplasmatota archaeon]|nr:hypothetical protein [Candidatus Thermoplasmatota archaeon]
MRFKLHHILFMCCSGWMMGIGLRFFLMQPTEIYRFSLIDKFFDWAVLFILGVLLLLFAVYEYLKAEEDSGN